MEKNENLFCPNCGAPYAENHLSRIDYERQRFAVLCTACDYESEAPLGPGDDAGAALAKALEPWRRG